MKKLRIRVKAPKKYTATTQSKHDEPVALNRLGRDFHASVPATKWVGDITYFQTCRQWYYLTVVIDLADRYVVAWTISDRMSAATTTETAFKRAAAHRSPARGCCSTQTMGYNMPAAASVAYLKNTMSDRACPEKGIVGIMP